MVAEHVEKMQARNDELNQKLSAGTYAWKQTRNFVVNVVGAVAGWHVGGLFKSKQLQTHASHIGQYSHLHPWLKAVAEHPNKAIGAFIGNSVAVLALGYEHWAQAEAQRLAIDEVNRDISEARMRMNPELMRENAMLREMLAKSEHAPTPVNAPAPSTGPHAVITTKDAVLEPSAHAQGTEPQVG